MPQKSDGDRKHIDAVPNATRAGNHTHQIRNEPKRKRQGGVNWDNLTRRSVSGRVGCTTDGLRPLTAVRCQQRIRKTALKPDWS
mmetsp:Transcript_16219/g.37170  ORF Transcript_16219/g.37170 Transcript_16219/m.37170 type:complete len:84 (-) Transcript_16219:22-273(-)